jgi:phenylalanyl-tRNA synthetase beta chain
MAGNVSDDDFRHPIQPVTYYDLSGTVTSIVQLLGIDLQQLDKSEFSDNLFSEGIMLTHKGNVWIKIGEVSPQICKHFEIKSKIFYADLTWDLLLNLTNHNIVFKEISKFPPVKRDLSLVIDKSVSFSEIEKIARRIEPQLIQDIRVFDVYEGERIDANKKAYAITFILQDSEKTLTDKIIDKTMSRLMKAFEEQSGAVIRQ